MKNATTTVPGTTAAEAEVLAATAATLAAGGDPFGDLDDDDAPAAAATAAADEDEAAEEDAAPAANSADGEAGDDGANGGDDLSAAALEAVSADDEQPTAVPRYTTTDLADLAAQRKDLTTTKAKALKDLMDGVIEPEEYSRIEGEVADKLDALTVQRTLHEANAQTDARQQADVLSGIIEAAKQANEVDYAGDQLAAKQFDTAMKMLGEDGTKRSYAKQAADAHKMVLALRGVTKVEPTTTAKADPAKPRENGKGPMTLRNVPAAAVAQTGGGWVEQLNSLSGQEYEEAFSKLTPAQRAQLLND